MLDVKELSVTLVEGAGKRNLPEKVSFTLRPGESLGIVGESGSGKTITALALLQLLPPGMKITRGNILIGSTPGRTLQVPGAKTRAPGTGHPFPGNGSPGLTDLARFNEKQMQAYRGRVISMIFQEPMTSLNPSMRCGEQIRESVCMHLGYSAKDAREKVFSLLGEVHLPRDPAFYRKYPHQLSGGQRQRVMIAMALAGNPEILIADEPTTALDVTVQKKILDLLKEIRENRRMSMLFISHDLGVIRKVCEHTLVMYRGKIVESGSVARLFSRPEHPYTRGLIACRPGPEMKPGRLPTLTDFTPDTQASPGTSGTQHGPGESKPDPPIRRKEHPEESPAENSPLLEVKSLQVEYTLKRNFLGIPVKKLRAVDNISFHIEPGETLGLIGESGCGKSTLGRSLIRLIQSREGRILYRGENISSLKGKGLNAFRQKVQFIFQDPYSSLNPALAVGPAILEVMRVHGIYKGKKERKEAAIDLLGRVGLEPEQFGRYPHEFSGGQRQRIGLARALATGPELIICDESVSSLDVSVQAMILNLLNELKESFKLTYLFISHDLSVVRYMSDRILVMKDGRLVEEADCDALFAHPSSAHTRELIGSMLP